MASLMDGESSPLLSEYVSANVNEDSPIIGNLDDSSGSLALKIAAAMYSFITLGLFNSSIGAGLPQISQHYSLTDLHVSLLFLAAPVGYIGAALSSNNIHRHFGQRGIAILGPSFHIVATTIIAVHPSFGLVLVAFAIYGLGIGLLDGSWCAWTGGMKRGNTISGLLHGSYSIGAAAAPFFVALMTTTQRPWWLWYHVLTGASVLELVFLVVAFRGDDAATYRQSKQSEGSDIEEDIMAVMKYRATWLCAVYLLVYVGSETTISGWIVSSMLRNRNATPYLANLSSSGFWIGMACGRLLLGFGTDRIGVRTATIVYFLFAIGLEVLFVTTTAPIVSVALMTMVGFAMGPFFPSAVVVLTQLLPKGLHVAAASFVASVGQVGGAFLPFAIGAIVQTLGISVFPFAILLETTFALLVWLPFTRLQLTHSTTVA